MEPEKKKRLISCSLQNTLPELVLKNANVVDVFTKRVFTADIAVQDGLIVGVGDYRGRREVDLTGKYAAPGFIDAHVHIESSMVSPSLFARTVLACGTTTVIADPHEIVNVAGASGLKYMLADSENACVNVYFMLPSCVPAGPHEHNGAAFGAEQMKPFLGHPRVLGLGEVMDRDAVLSGDGEMLEKIGLLAGRVIDGHAPSLTGKALQAYRLAGVQTDHECSGYEEALERIRAGFVVQIREGSAARNLEAIVSGALADGLDFDRFVFCTDDLHLDDAVRLGHIGNCVRKAAALGLDPVQAIRCASLNAAQLYGLADLGAIAPGFCADLVILDNLKDLTVLDVYKDGVPYAERQSACRPAEAPASLKNSVRVPEIGAESFSLKTSGDFPVISLVLGEIVTKKELLPLPGENGVFTPRDGLLKVAVIQRHDGSGRVGLGAVKGFGLKNGAVASTVAHDSHNLIVIGDNDRDMCCAIAELCRCQGGYTVCSGGRVLCTLPLPVAGLFTDDASLDVAGVQREMSALCRQMGVGAGLDPFQNLSFLSLSVIPEIRVTDGGVFDVLQNRFFS